MYKCAKCGAFFEELPAQTVRCPACSYKIVFKQRDPIAKEVIAR
jgi:DNA-directed RNA polymerase subunit RPC12/RpoP